MVSMHKQKFKKSIRGQIAIFLALIFVVLFTLFGLTINVSMVVHDKINLQNATDLASYYVAQRQAEMLNAIAHTNYQMRQAWKLFVFRYRVIGSIGRRGASNAPMHPALNTVIDNFRLSESNFWGAESSVCAAAPYFFAPLQPGDYLCKDLTVTVPTISAGSVSLPGLGGAGVVTGGITAVNTTIARTCESQTYFNWWYSLVAFESFQQEQASRKAIIRSLVRNLSQPITRGGMKDLDGNDVYEGAFRTFQYNLSQSNKELDENYNLQIENSLSGVSQNQWLPEITVDAIVPYVRFVMSASGCATSPEAGVANLDPVDPIVGSVLTAQFENQLDPENIIRDQKGYSFSPNELRTLSVGVEKNPWYMVYNKITASVFSKALFSANTDTGVGSQRGIQISAVSYAKPFGGKIGPWFMSRWPSGTTQSQGGTKIDSVGPPRSASGVGALNASDPTLQPNYSRYPGDRRGLLTESSMVALGRLTDWDINGPQDFIRADDLVMSVYSFFGDSVNSDPLAQRLPTATGNVAPQDAYLRKLEIAAVAPDAFDVAYYSVFPGFWDNFGSKLSSWIQPEGGNQNYKIRGDLGFMPEAGGIYANYDVMNQLEESERVQTITGSGNPNDKRLAPWFVKRLLNGRPSPNRYSYLNGWNSGENVMEYVTPSLLGERFAGCESGGDISTQGSTAVKIPGECIKGGRVGYSVKLISKSYLDSQHPIGGEGVSGNILNSF